MKIRQQLALRFTLVSALLTGAILILIYILTRGFVHSDFVERLTQQSSLEILHYANPSAKEVMPSNSFFLVNPITSIYDIDGKLLYRHGEYTIPPDWISSVQSDAIFTSERGDYTTVGRQYNIGGMQYLVFVSDKDSPGQHELDILIKGMLFGWMISLLLSYVAGLYFSSNALRPVKHVVKEVNRINKDNLSYRLQPANKDDNIDEIDELIITFNALLTRIESAFITQKRFVQNASHELKTPLTAIMAEAELALTKDRPVDEYKRTLNVIMIETERLVRITQALLTLARIEERNVKSEMERVSVSTLLRETLDTFRLHYPDKKIDASIDKLDGYVMGNMSLLQTALLNILDNAAKYSNGQITVTSSNYKTSVLIGIRDYGIGIPESDLQRIRIPLFRAANVADVPGAGLGLSLVDRILKVHDGSLEIISTEGKGTYCEIILSKDPDIA